MAEFVLNNHLHAAHRMTPFEVMYGYRPDFTIPMSPPTKFPALNIRLQHLRDNRKDTEAALRMEKRAMKEATQNQTPPPHDFSVGLWVKCRRQGWFDI